MQATLEVGKEKKSRHNNMTMDQDDVGFNTSFSSQSLSDNSRRENEFDKDSFFNDELRHDLKTLTDQLIQMELEEDKAISLAAK